MSKTKNIEEHQFEIPYKSLTSEEMNQRQQGVDDYIIERFPNRVEYLEHGEVVAFLPLHPNRLREGMRYEFFLWPKVKDDGTYEYSSQRRMIEYRLDNLSILPIRA